MQSGHLGHATLSAGQQTQAQVVLLQAIVQNARHSLGCSSSCQLMQAFDVVLVRDAGDLQVQALQQSLSTHDPAAELIETTDGVVPGSSCLHTMSATALQLR